MYIILNYKHGILSSSIKSYFHRCLHSPGGALQYKPLKCARIINSCILLHNRCMKRGIPVPADVCTS